MTSQFMPKNFDSHHYRFDIAQQQTLSYPAVPPFAFTEQATQPLPLSEPSTPSTTTELFSHNSTGEKLHEGREGEEEKEATRKARKLRLLAIFIIIALGCAVYFIWRTPATNTSAASLISQSSATTTNVSKKNVTSSATTDTANATIEVYITGAVQHPGVYNLNSGARVYQLLQLAGGPLPNADLVALNLAERLVDGQEIYVNKIGETPPITSSTGTTNTSTRKTTRTSSSTNSQGPLVNINSASETELRQNLHLSSKSALEIINYRQLHGPFTSIDELLQAVSKTIYNKIKNQVTI